MKIIRHKNANRILAAAAALLLTFFCAVPAAAAVDPGAVYSVDSDYWEYWPEAAAITGDTAVLMDADTGTILYSKGLDAQRFPASITKVMTALVVLENCDLSEQVVMTETGMADAYSGSSNVNPTLGEIFTVEQCLQMLLVKSANDIASQLAEHTAGSVAAFADLMNARAASLGCTNTHFTNASGLEDDNHYTSARDMALIMQAAIQNEVFRNILMMPGVEIPATNTSAARYYYSHVYLTDPESRFYYEGCMGGKTGYTPISASTLVCYAQRDGMTLIGVVLGAPETESNASDMITIFDYGFHNFHHVNAVSGVECLNGGNVTLPNGVEADVLTLSAAENGENEDVTFLIGDHRIGSCTMTKDSYHALQVLRGEAAEEESGTAQPAVTGQESVQESTGGTVSSVSTPSEKKTAPAETDAEAQKSSPVLYVIIIILGIAILLALVYLSQRGKGSRKRSRKKTRSSNRKKTGRK